MKTIQGVEIKELTTHSDERGFFREVLRVTDGVEFGQWSYAKRDVGTGEWHIHQHQTDWWHVPIGAINAILRDDRPDSPTYNERNVYFMSGAIPSVLKIPPGVAHGFIVVKGYTGIPHEGPIYLFYITSQVYNPDDEGRLPYSDEDMEWFNL